jgi:hypothetical protein
MKPVVKPGQPNVTASYTALIGAMVAAIGGYCCFCEKVLNFSTYLFDKQRGVITKQTPLSLSDWDNLLLICGDCIDNLTNFNAQTPYLWPDSQVAQTFPFRYVKRDSVIYQVVDAQGTIIQETQPSFVFVEVATGLDSATAQAAHNIINLFQLNSKYYNNNPQQRQVIIPATDFVQGFDLRLDQRYHAYQSGVEVAEGLKQALPTLQINRGFITNMLRMAHIEIRHTGYISTWEAAVLDTLDADSLNKIFYPETQSIDMATVSKRVIEELLSEEAPRSTKKPRWVK